MSQQSTSKQRSDEVDVLHLGCGEDYHDDAWNVDAVGECDPDEVYDLTDYPWPWEDESFGLIRSAHCFEHLPDMERALRESRRVLEPGGRLILKLPVGLDAIADPDHSWGESGKPWTWRTPEFFCGKRHWDVDVGLEVTHRECELWSVAPSRWKRGFIGAIWEWRLVRKGPGPWCFGLPNSCGELTVVFEKP